MILGSHDLHEESNILKKISNIYYVESERKVHTQHGSVGYK